MESSNYTTSNTTAVILWGFFSPILLFVGVTGNCLVVTVLVFKRQGAVNSLTVFRTVLAITDMVILLTVLPKYWLEYVVDIDIRSFSSAGCKLSLFITYVSMQYSAWIIVTMTVQRCLLIYKPFTFKRLWTLKVTIISLICVFCVLSMIDFHYFITNEVQNNSCVSKTAEIEDFEDFVFVFIDLAFLCLIPFAFMLVGNIYFMAFMKRQIIFRKSLTEGQRNPPSYVSQQNAKATRLVMKLTWLFLLTTLPICIEMIVDSVYKEQKDAEFALDLAKTICYLIQLVGISLNVCIYIKCDNKFRQQLGTIFNCYGKREWARSTGSTRNTSVSNKTNSLSTFTSVSNHTASVSSLESNPTRGMRELDTKPRKASDENCVAKSTHM